MASVSRSPPRRACGEFIQHQRVSVWGMGTREATCMEATACTHLGERRAQRRHDHHVIEGGVAALVRSRVASRAVLRAGVAADVSPKRIRSLPETQPPQGARAGSMPKPHACYLPASTGRRCRPQPAQQKRRGENTCACRPPWLIKHVESRHTHRVHLARQHREAAVSGVCRVHVQVMLSGGLRLLDGRGQHNKQSNY